MVPATGGLLLGLPSLLTSLHWKWVGNSTSLGFEKFGITMLITSISWNIILSTMIIPIFIARTPSVTLHSYIKNKHVFFPIEQKQIEIGTSCQCIWHLREELLKGTWSSLSINMLASTVYYFLPNREIHNAN